MKIQEKIFKLEGKVQHYVWGGYHFIPQLLGIENSNHAPYAEYWMGVHPLAPSVLHGKKESYFLNEIIIQNGEDVLGKKAFSKYHNLPYLFKVLDVHDMLSIQVHPTKAAAAKGFAAEEKKKIPHNAPHRNYKDGNDKPEMALALSEFWLLHGFLTKQKINKLLDENAAFKGMKKIFVSKGYKGLYQHIMTLPQEKVNERLMPLVKEEIEKKSLGKLSKQQPGWWVCKLFNDETPRGNIDRGVFSIYLLNIVQMKPGQAIFQGAGLLHAYLEGQNLELMTNSDNVLRGGLTPKHIDVPELMKHTKFQTTIPSLIKPKKVKKVETNYPVPVDSFAFSSIVLNTGESHQLKSSSVEIWIAMDGKVSFAGTNKLSIEKGEVVCVFANESFTIKASKKTLLYRAFVNV